MKTASPGTAPLRSALLEIGTEEIPARFMPEALAQLLEMARTSLAQARISVETVQVWGTPRRLTLFLSGVATRSTDRIDTVIGPPPKAARDEAGFWTAAATGFAKAQKTSVEKLVIENTPKGERYVAKHAIKGQKTELVLKELFPALIRKLTFPKSMIWDDKEFRFARPIRWVVALYNSTVIRFRIAAISSDRTTVGLLSLGGQRMAVSKPEKYKTLLQGRCVLVDPEERRRHIKSQLETIGKRVKGNVIADPAHIDEVVFLTEHPTSIVGHFPEAYLALPKEVLVVVLKKQQKFFPIESTRGGSTGRLMNSFIGVRNGTSEAQEEVREGYERVVNARFSDAKFFYEKDAQTPLEALASKLSGVGFHEKLGSMADKTDRVRALIADIGGAVALDDTILGAADRVGLLAKADLLTQMVGEFPELQGVAGRFYAEKTETPEIAAAIEQHYWPLTAEGALPQSDLAALVAVADKMDTLAADFSIGLVPSGSADPYGLRRAGIGVLRILLDRGWDLSFETLAQKAVERLASDAAAKAKTRTALLGFFEQRCANWFAHQGFRPDEIEAVLVMPGQSLPVISEKLKSLKAVRGRPEFDALAAAIKRARNILNQARERNLLPPSMDIAAEELSPVERALYDAVAAVREPLSAALGRREFEAALFHLAPLKSPVDDFFAGVMVMVEDERVRSQRLRLLMQVQRLFDSLVDFARLQGTTAPAAPAPVTAAASGTAVPGTAAV